MKSARNEDNGTAGGPLKAEVVSLADRRSGEAAKHVAAVAAGIGEEEKQKRVASLDAFRGFTILGMLLVNNIALDTATPKHLMHAPWNHGVTFADMIFPWFLFISGVVIPWSEAAHMKSNSGSWRYDLRILTRTAALFALGCLIDSCFARKVVVDLGVLQIIGLASAAAALLQELSPIRRAAIAFGLLAGYWAAIRFLPVPNVGVGVFTESKNLVRHLNDVYLQPVGLRGLISVVPTTALVMIGALTGGILRRRNMKDFVKAALLIGGGALLIAAGWLWNLDLPFNKPVWTPSYVVFSAGWGALILGLLYLVIDAAGFGFRAFPLVVFGANALAAYVAPVIFKALVLNSVHVTRSDGAAISLQQELYNFFFGIFGRVPGGWFYTFSYISIWWLWMWLLYRKRIYLRV
jgi:predicted acyltransferase